MKKTIRTALALLLCLALTATGCAKKNTTTLSATDTEMYAKVTAVSDKTVSVEVVSVPQTPGDGMDFGNPPEMPQGDTAQGNPPEMPQGDTAQGNPPEMPQGGTMQGNPPEMPQGDMAQGNPPEMPQGGTMQGNPPEMPQDGNASLVSTGETGTVTIQDTSVLFKSENGSEVSATLSDVTSGCILKLTFNTKGNIEKAVICEEKDLFGDMTGMGGMGFNGGQSSAPASYDAVRAIGEDTTLSGDTVESSGNDENAILVTGGTVSIDNVTVNRVSTGSTGGDNASFYGVGAAILATDGVLNVSNSTVTTDSAGGAGVFAYGSSVVSVKGSAISTVQNTSGGIHAAGGGTLYATALDVVTNGESSAAIRSDRGGGTMIVNGGTYTSNGTGSPAIYCTADISVKDSTLTATNSEAICIEGKNSVKLFDCTLNGNMPDQQANDCTWTVIVYQSMSGDAEVGSGTFQMTGGKLISNNGGLFYTTNTSSHIILENVTIEKSADAEFLLACLGNNNARGWGSAGSNGAQCTFTAISQMLDGNVLWDSVSELNFYLTNGSVLSGAVIQDDSFAGEGGNGFCNLYIIGDDSKWIVTADSTLNTLCCAGTLTDADGNTVSVIGTDGTVYIEGNSAYTVTVNSFSFASDSNGPDEAVAKEAVDFR